MNTPLENNPPLIELTQVEVVSGLDSAVTQVREVNWRVHAGDYWVVGGANASGKSDLIGTAACLQRPGSGSIRIFGHEVSALPEAELLAQRLRIGIVFKNGGRLFAHLTVAENIALPLRYRFNWKRGHAENEVDALLELTELTEYAHHPAGALGLHLQQRAALARALALKPEALFLDEPLAGLELQHRLWWLELLGRLLSGTPFTGGKPLALAVATNDFERWIQHGRQFAVIKDKRWLTLGGPEEVVEKKA